MLKNNEVVYSFIFGTAFSSETLAQVKDTLGDFIKDPMEGMIFSRPLFNFQVVYASIQKLFFLLVADQSDRPEYVKEVMKPTATKFIATFPNIPNSLKDTEKQNVFEQYLLEVHKNLHPKIALVGPLGAGKTTLAQLIQAQGSVERPIMNFGKIYSVQIGKLTFDLWDWVFPDMFSPLWNNFVRGSDVILVVMIWACYDQVLQELVVESPMMNVSKAWFAAAMPVGLTLMLIHVLRIGMDQGAAPVFRGETEVLIMKEGEVK